MLSNGDVNNVSDGLLNVKITNAKHKDLYFSNIDNEYKSIPEETLINRIKKTVEKNPNYPVLKYKSDPEKDYDITITLKEYLEQITKAAKGFITIGLEEKAAIGIIGFNHPAWFISELGAIFAGGIVCGIYTTNTAEICKFIMNDCNCQIVVVENDDQLEKILSILPNLPQLKAIIKFTGIVDKQFENRSTIPIYSWEQFLNIETSNSIKELERRQDNIKPKDCAILVYTSGTTGLPKGVMLSHDNILFTLRIVQYQIELKEFDNVIVSYLPLSHVAANMLDIASSACLGTTIYFAQPDALKGSLMKTLKEARPTVFMGVPRVFEKMQEQLQEIEVSTNKELDRSKILKAIGLDRCEYIASAAAPISPQTLEYFYNKGITIHQIYGMSECCGPQTVDRKNESKIGYVGSLLKGIEMKIHDPNEDQVGEICMRGRHVFLGYYNNEEKTRETIDSEHWLHSGDLGKVDEDGYLAITGRIKELLITAGGENIAPVPIENNIKNEFPFISNVMLVGDRQKFLSCLLTLKTEVDPETQFPTDTLSDAAIRSLEILGIKASKIEHVMKGNQPQFKSAIDQGLKRVNSLSVSKATYVQKWAILPRDFSLKGGELGPTLKVKRMVVTEQYADLIKSIYEV